MFAKSPRQRSLQPSRTCPSVVIVGAGFGGLAAARALGRSPCAVTVIDRRNYHLFQPLLYQVATAALSPADVAWPIRGLLSRQENARVILGRVSGVDTRAREVLTEDGGRYPYDYLILGTGARHHYFGRDAEWEPFAPGLKKIDDATEIRRRVLTAFEEAEGTPSATLQRRLLTFVVVGGGPTGVEMAGAIAELARHTLRRDFRRIDPRQTRVILAEAGPRVLAQFPEHLSRKAAAALKRLGVELRLGVPVTDCSAEGAVIDGERIPAATIVWAAGVIASPAARWLGAAADRAGRIIVEPDLGVPGLPNVYAIGDTVAIHDDAGRPVPGVAPAAKQMGAHVGRAVARHIAGQAGADEPFRYRDAGAMATIGRGAAIARIGRLSLSGYPAWLLWALAHVYFLIGNRNRVSVALSWVWIYLWHSRGARLITGQADAPPAVRAPEAGTG